MNVIQLIDKIKEIRKHYNKNSGILYGFNERFDEVVEEINAILMYLKDVSQVISFSIDDEFVYIQDKGIYRKQDVEPKGDTITINKILKEEEKDEYNR